MKFSIFATLGWKKTPGIYLKVNTIQKTTKSNVINWVNSWFKGTVSPCDKLMSVKRAWTIIIFMKIAIAFDSIYQEIKWSEYPKLVGNAMP